MEALRVILNGMAHPVTLTGEADTDITAGSLRAPHARWDKSPILTMKVKLLKYRRLTIKNLHWVREAQKDTG